MVKGIERVPMRECMVGTKDSVDFTGYFHGWTFESQVVDASPLIGGHPGGQVSGTFAIVENKRSGVVSLVHPSRIQFMKGV